MTIDFATIRERHALVDVVARYVPDLKRSGSEYIGTCCFHNDSKPSLTIYRGRDGTQRYRCFPCGEQGDVIDFMAAIESVTPAEACKRLEGNSLPAPGAIKRHELPPDESDVWVPILPAPDNAPAYDPAATYNPKRGRAVRWQPTRCDAVRDAQGRILGHVVRMDFDDGSKITPCVTFCEGPDGRRLWAAKRFPRPTPLVGLDELAKRPAAEVLVVSGEKCRAVAAERLPGFVAVTWIGGDPGIEYADLGPLRGRRLMLWPDADASGHAAMVRLQERLA